MDSIVPSNYRKPDGYKNVHTSELKDIYSRPFKIKDNEEVVMEMEFDNNMEKLREKLDNLEIEENESCHIL